MADKVKLTPPMTDSKTPEWAREAAAADLGPPGVHVHHVSYEIVADRISQALLSAYERGRKEGIEEAASFLQENHTIIAGEPADPLMPSLVEAIRQLLEVKG